MLKGAKVGTIIVDDAGNPVGTKGFAPGAEPDFEAGAAAAGGGVAAQFAREAVEAAERVQGFQQGADAAGVPTHPDAEGGPITIKARGGPAAELAAAWGAVGIETRRNVRSGHVELRFPEWADAKRRWRSRDGGAAAERAAAVASASLVLYVDEQTVKPVPTGAAAIAAAKRMVAFNAPEADPFLDRVRATPWDKTERIDGLLEHLFEIDPDRRPSDKLLRTASRLPWMTAITRALRPGALVRGSLVLQSEGEFVGKSAFVRSMVFGDDDLIAEDFPFGVRMQEQVEKLQGVVVVEIADAEELLDRPEKTRALLTMRNLKGVRLAWAPEPQDTPARHVFVVSANRDEFLPPDDENTRFLVVPILRAKGRIEDALTPAVAAQCWAEALVRVEAGEHPDVPRGLLAEQVRRNVAYIGAGGSGKGDAWKVRVQTVLDANERDWVKSGVTLEELTTRVKLRYKSVGTANIDGPVAAAARKAGLVRARDLVRGQRTRIRGYRYPKAGA